MFNIFTIFNLRDGVPRAHVLDFSVEWYHFSRNVSGSVQFNQSGNRSGPTAQTAQVFLMEIPYLTLFRRHNVSGFNKDY